MASMIEYKRMLAERDLASVWPQWRIVKLLGAGAFGEVYEIQRDEYGRTSRCALKILRRENTPSTSSDIYTNISRGNTAEDFINTVLREIDIMEKLKGAPNIVVIDDYDRAAADKDIHPEKQNRESKYNSTGIIIVIVLCIVLIPTLGSAIVGLLVGLYSLIVAFPTTGVALIAAGGALSAKSLWVCMGLILIGISFLALTGLIVMAAIEGTKLFVKLVRYIIKECKKMIKEGSF